MTAFHLVVRPMEIIRKKQRFHAYRNTRRGSHDVRNADLAGMLVAQGNISISNQAAKFADLETECRSGFKLRGIKNHFFQMALPVFVHQEVEGHTLAAGKLTK